MSHPSEYNYLGSWDSNGVPDYLDSSETIDPLLLDRINETLPEKGNVENHSPHYLTNMHTRNIIIKTDDVNFDGAEVTVTFITEGAGYKNVFGYYWYDLHDNLEVPSKLVDGVYVPMEYDDRDNVVDGKYILNKTIVFPNASLKRKGGKLVPGNRVKLQYDVNDASVKFPNNIGIGFFLIPNGWKSWQQTFSHKSGTVYSDRVFNSHNPDVDGNIQVILFDDTEHNGVDGSLILGMEDIMRPGGDSDFNDLIIKINYTPSTIYNTDNLLTVAPSMPFESMQLASDSSGLYIYLENSDIVTMLDNPTENFLITQVVTSTDEVAFQALVDTFNDLDSNFDKTVTQVSGTDFQVEYVVPRGAVSNNIYLFDSGDNIDVESTFDPKSTALVLFQDNYIFGDTVTETLTIQDQAQTTTLTTGDMRPDTSRMTGPLAMGDPHITTIYNKYYTTPDKKSRYTLLENHDVLIRCLIDKYPKNSDPDLKDRELYQDHVFMQYMFVELKKDQRIVVLDMFNPGVYYLGCKTTNSYNRLYKKDGPLAAGLHRITAAELPPFLQAKDTPDDEFARLRTEMAVNKDSKEFEANTYTLTTRNMGKIKLQIVFMLDWRDYINSIKMDGGGLFLMKSEGLMIDVNFCEDCV